jgi:hypothetical protein
MEEASDPPACAHLVLVVGGREVALGPLARSGCDLALVDEILQLGLAAGRVGASIRLVEVQRDLRELVELVGLADHLGL